MPLIILPNSSHHGTGMSLSRISTIRCGSLMVAAIVSDFHAASASGRGWKMGLVEGAVKELDQNKMRLCQVIGLKLNSPS